MQKPVRKPKTFHDAELNTAMSIELLKQEYPLLSSTFEELNERFNAATLQRLSSSYGYLTDAIFSYLRDYSEGKADGTVWLAKFEPIPEDRAKGIEMEEVIVICDKFKNFCKRAGILNSMQRKTLLDEIRGIRKGQRFSGFSTIGLSQVIRDKKTHKVIDFAFREYSFLSYEIKTELTSKLKNLRNLKGNPTKAISKVKLQLNYEIFKPALINQRGSGTRGHYFLPDRLEMWLRRTVKSHKKELQAFCKNNGYYYLKGTGYPKTIRPFFNYLIRETIWKKDENGFMEVKKPIKKIAAVCCEGAFVNTAKGIVFNKMLAVELLTHALEVLKYMFIDGIKFIEISDYHIDNEYLVVRMRHQQKETYEPQLS